MYVTKQDYRGRINSDLLDVLLAENEAGILADVSKIAEDTIKTYVGELYSIDDEFTKTSTARNYMVLSMAIAIALYNIYSRADDTQIPDKVVKDFDDTIDDLQKISNGKAKLSLPKYVPETTGTTAGDETASTDGTGLRRFGSNKKRTHLP